MIDDLDHGLSALAAEARRLEIRIGRVSTRTSEDFKTVLIIETVGLLTPEVGALSDALNTFRRRRDLAAEFLIVNSTGPTWASSVPSGWPQ